MANTCYSLGGTIWSRPLIKEEQKESALSDYCVSDIGNRVLWLYIGRHIGVWLAYLQANVLVH